MVQFDAIWLILHEFGLSVGGDDDEDDDEEGGGEEKLPSCMDYVMHFLTIFWKVIFAFVPPTGKIVRQFMSL